MKFPVMTSFRGYDISPNAHNADTVFGWSVSPTRDITPTDTTPTVLISPTSAQWTQRRQCPHRRLLKINLKGTLRRQAKWLIYLTNWGFTACTIQSVLCTAMLTICYLDARNERPEENHKVLQLYRVYWTANIVATDVAFGVTIIYWSLIYDEAKVEMDGMNIIVHICNSLIMFIDLFIVAHPVRLLHFYCPMICGACYIVFSVIYYLAGGTNKDGSIAIYPILNWSKPGMTILICLLITLFLLFIHILTYCIYKFRKVLYKYLSNKKGKGTEEAQTKEGCINPVPISFSEVV
ncbi:hypothetical protein FQR65_LT00431 [Abscondita terminalis]|nr:hypothetical protein FQR65_LT00431 [Abscondita terminalis]